MKRGFYILMILCVALVAVSCGKTKSYTEYLKDERKAIERLERREGFSFREDYPSNGVFKENEFVKLDNDVYLNVIDSGNGERAVLGETKVLCRFVANRIKGDSTAKIVNNLIYEPGWYAHPTEFIYGINSYSGEARNYDPDLFNGEGLASALNHVGNGAIVQLIVPFKRMGSFFQSSYEPIYFSRVKYTFEK